MKPLPVVTEISEKNQFLPLGKTNQWLFVLIHVAKGLGGGVCINYISISSTVLLLDRHELAFSLIPMTPAYLYTMLLDPFRFSLLGL